MLKFLLLNDMPLDCLNEPPIHAFLTIGMGTDDYPVEQAINVAKIIEENSVMRINERDSQGQTIFDRFEKLPETAKARLLPLREVLTEMGK